MHLVRCSSDQKSIIKHSRKKNIFICPEILNMDAVADRTLSCLGSFLESKKLNSLKKTLDETLKNPKLSKEHVQQK